MSFNNGNIDNLEILIENQTLTSNGTAQVTIDTSQYKEFWFTVRIDGPVTGSSPTLQFSLYDQDLFGVSVTGNVTNSAVYTSSITAESFKHTTETGLMQLNWVITGAGASFGGVYAAITGLKDSTVTGQQTMDDSVAVVIASDQSALPISGSVSIASGSVTVNNAAGASAVNIQDGGNSITVDGTVAATQSGTWNINNITGTVSLPTGASTAANQTTEITSLQILDDVPATQNAAFVRGNPSMGQLDDVSTVVATEDNVAVTRITAQRALHTNLRNNAGTEIATSANPLRTDPTGTTAQPVTDNGGSLTVDGTVAISGTVAVTQSTSPWVTQDNADGPVTPGTVATKSGLIGGQYNSTLPTLTNTQQAAVQLDSSGRVLTTTSITSVASTVAPSLSAKLKSEPTFTTIAIPSSVSYTTIYTYSGSGYFLGFNLEFNNTAIVVKVVIDGNTVMDGNDIGAYNTLAATSGSSAKYQFGLGIISAASVIDFSTRYPIAYTTSVVISARLTSGATSRNFNQGIVYIQKDT